MKNNGNEAKLIIYNNKYKQYEFIPVQKLMQINCK